MTIRNLNFTKSEVQTVVTFKLVSIEEGDSGITNFALYRDANGNSVYFDKNISQLPSFITLSIDNDLYILDGKVRKDFIFNIHNPGIGRLIRTNLDAQRELNDIYGEIDRYSESEVPNSVTIIFQREEITKQGKMADGNFVYYVNAIGEKIRVPKSNNLEEFIEVPFNPRMYTAFSRTYHTFKGNKDIIFPSFFYNEAGIESLNETRVNREGVIKMMKMVRDGYDQNPSLINLGFNEIPRPEIMNLLINSQRVPIENKIENDLRNTIARLQLELATRDKEIKQFQEVLNKVMEERDGIRRNLEETMNRSQLDVLNENLTRTLQEKDLLIKRLQQEIERLQKENANLSDYLSQR